MRQVEPEVFLVAGPKISGSAVESYLKEVGAEQWMKRNEQIFFDSYDGHGGELVELGGRLCYRSWEPGLNPNVTKIREDSSEYLENILKSKHGSVLEHAHYSFVFHNVSRVFTHELVRHRHENISQESMRFVRLMDIPFWFPKWAQEDTELMKRASALLEEMEMFQVWMADHFGLDEEGTPFHEKKAKTSFMRRFAPDGVATGLLWTANIRSLRWVIEARTSAGAEEEIRLVFAKVGTLMKRVAPDLFGDFEENEEGEWIPKYSKV